MTGPSVGGGNPAVLVDGGGGGGGGAVVFTGGGGAKAGGGGGGAPCLFALEATAEIVLSKVIVTPALEACCELFRAEASAAAAELGAGGGGAFAADEPTCGEGEFALGELAGAAFTSATKPFTGSRSKPFGGT